METVGQRIRTARIGEGLSQGELGEAVGVRYQAVNKWENNKAIPEGDNLMKVAAALKVDVQELVGGSPNTEAPSSPQALKGWVGKRLGAVTQGLNEWMELIIEAEVERRLSEELQDYGITRPLSPETRKLVREYVQDLDDRARTRGEPDTSGPPPEKAQQAQRSPRGKKAVAGNSRP